MTATIPAESEIPKMYKSEIQHLHRQVVIQYQQIMYRSDVVAFATLIRSAFENVLEVIDRTLVSHGQAPYESLCRSYTLLKNMEVIPNAVSLKPIVQLTGVKELADKVEEASKTWLLMCDSIGSIVDDLMKGTPIKDISFTDAIEHLVRLGSSYSVIQHVMNLFHDDGIDKKYKDYIHIYHELYINYFKEPMLPTHIENIDEYYATIIACIINPTLYEVLFAGQPRLVKVFCCLPDVVLEREFVRHAYAWLHHIGYPDDHRTLVTPTEFEKIKTFIRDSESRKPLLEVATKFRNSLVQLDQ